MYLLGHYDQFKRYEQQRLDRVQKKERIADVQQMLIYSSKQAAQAGAKSTIRKIVMRNKLVISEQEMDAWADKITIHSVE